MNREPNSSPFTSGTSATRSLIVGLLTIAASFGVQAGAIVSGKNSSLPPLSPEMARRTFLGREPKIEGQEITVFYQQNGDTRTDFEIKVLGKTGAELNRYMARMIFTGDVKPPLETSGDESVKSKVNSRPGAVGYISDRAIDSTVKVLFKY